jgi:hypothetical protein
MKLYFNKPKNNWLSPYTIIEKIIFWRDIDYDEPLVKNIIKYTKLGWFCSVLFDVRKFFNRDIRYVKIDAWDTWSMDSTLSPIILPMLKQLKATKHGAPHVDNQDVPLNLRDKRKVQPKNGETDKNYFKRWDWVLDEMIWAFTELNKDDWAEPFWTGTSDTVWVKLPNGYTEMKHGPNHTLKFDKKGHDRHWARIQNGLKLFGKYYTSLWD